MTFKDVIYVLLILTNWLQTTISQNNKQTQILYLHMLFTVDLSHVKKLKRAAIPADKAKSKL